MHPITLVFSWLEHYIVVIACLACPFQISLCLTATSSVRARATELNCSRKRVLLHGRHGYPMHQEPAQTSPRARRADSSHKLCLPIFTPPLTRRNQSTRTYVHAKLPMLPSMDATNTKKVIVTAYEELPRRRPSGHGASTSTAARAKTRASSASTHAAGGYSRRALLLAYAQQLRRRGGQQIRGPRMLEWGKWKAAPAGAGTGGDAVRKADMQTLSFFSTLINVRACQCRD